MAQEHKCQESAIFRESLECSKAEDRYIYGPVPLQCEQGHSAATVPGSETEHSGGQVVGGEPQGAVTCPLLASNQIR